MTERGTQPAQQRIAGSIATVSLTNVVGGVLLGCVVILLSIRLVIPELSELQRKFVFKILSGCALWLFIGLQWLLAVSRVRGWSYVSKLLFVVHQVVGVGGPVLLYVHVRSWGFGYLNVLSAAFLFNHALGLMQPRTPQRSRQFRSVWLISHIALSVVIVALASYHTWQAFYYE